MKFLTELLNVHTATNPLRALLPFSLKFIYTWYLPDLPDSTEPSGVSLAIRDVQDFLELDEPARRVLLG